MTTIINFNQNVAAYSRKKRPLRKRTKHSLKNTVRSNPNSTMLYQNETTRSLALASCSSKLTLGEARRQTS